MRTTLIPSILRVMALNQKRRNKDIKVYEVNRVYLPKQLPLTELPDERLKLCLAVSGKDLRLLYTEGRDGKYLRGDEYRRRV